MDNLISQIDNALENHPRVLLGIAAPPTAGKSTLTNALIAHYGSDAVVLPMDGFHLDNAILDARGLRSRKGAPETFDADGFVHAVKSVSQGQPIIAPSFDRELDLSRAGAIDIRDQKLVIVEGNYLLFDEAPWRELAQEWTLSVWLEVSIEEIERRAIERWLSYGFNPVQAEDRARGNDLQNARRVMEKKLDADISIVSE